MNRALRRQQLKDPKTDKTARAAPRAIPRTGPARPAARGEARGGILAWRPRFFMDIISELRKVVWPTREDTVHLTVVVVIVTIILGAVLGGIDIGFGWLIDRTLLK
ncbi:MAG: preprotein translocase subunit SecE [Dehalococcoidia bacterium]|nr:preprotein translocase subunit SecE [Dehalococcoidia bacterium]